MKGQSAIELLVTYGWAFLIIATVLGILAIVSFSRPNTSYLQNVCSIQPLMPCLETQVYPTGSSVSYTIEFVNNLGVYIYMTSNSQVIGNAISLTISNLGTSGSNSIGNCAPRLVPIGGTVLCTAKISGAVKPATGTTTTAYFTLSYELCGTSLQSACSNAIYKTTGFSQQLFNSGVSIYNLTVSTNTGNGLVVIDGIPYQSNANIPIVSGVHSAYGVPPSKYFWQQWSGTNVLIANVLTQNTVFTTNSPMTSGILVASFVSTTTVPSTTSVTSTMTTVATTTSIYCSLCR